MDPQLITMGVSAGAFAAIGPVYKGLLATFFQLVPAKARPWVSALVAVVLGALQAQSMGQPWHTGILPGLTMAGTAAWHHDKSLPAPATDNTADPES